MGKLSGGPTGELGGKSRAVQKREPMPPEEVGGGERDLVGLAPKSPRNLPGGPRGASLLLTGSMEAHSHRSDGLLRS